MRAWKCKQVVDFDKSTTTVKEERNRTLQQQMTDKYIVSKLLHICHDACDVPTHSYLLQVGNG